MRDEEIERVMNYLARRSSDHSRIDFDLIEEQLDSLRNTCQKMTEDNKQLSRVLKESKRGGRLVDIRLALLRWRITANDSPARKIP